MLIRVLYLSRLAPSTTASDVVRLVGSAQRRNRQLDITGALVLCERSFAQVLEGRLEVIEPMLATIEQDPRHVQMQVIERAVVRRRLFEHWDMAFVDEGASASLWEAVRRGTASPADMLSEITRLVDLQRMAVL